VGGGERVEGKERRKGVWGEEFGGGEGWAGEDGVIE